MTTRQEHLDLLKQRGKFILDCPKGVFSNEEAELLVKYGHWFQALTSGESEPITDSQRRFILVAGNKPDAFSIAEMAWWKYLDQKSYETRRQNNEVIQYYPQDDPFFSRNMVKQLRSTMRDVITA